MFQEGDNSVLPTPHPRNVPAFIAAFFNCLVSRKNIE